jgi:hypothetical protein
MEIVLRHGRYIFMPDLSNVNTVIPQDDGLMDLWIAGLLGLSSRKTIDTGF